MRLIYLDIKSMSTRRGSISGRFPYLKLINRREDLQFKVEEAYILDKNKVAGRLSSNDIIIGDPFISSTHARFLIKAGELYLEDLSSKNGTFLNGVKVKSGENICLKDGDKIRMGQAEFLFIKGV